MRLTSWLTDFRNLALQADSSYIHRMSALTALYNIEKRDDGWADLRDL